MPKVKRKRKGTKKVTRSDIKKLQAKGRKPPKKAKAKKLTRSKPLPAFPLKSYPAEQWPFPPHAQPYQPAAS